jgi:hypothetical protein
MPGLVPGIHVFVSRKARRGWPGIALRCHLDQPLRRAEARHNGKCLSKSHNIETCSARLQQSQKVRQRRISRSTGRSTARSTGRTTGATTAPATGRGRSTTPGLTTQPAGYSTYWQYTTAPAVSVLATTTPMTNSVDKAIESFISASSVWYFLKLSRGAIFELMQVNGGAAALRSCGVERVTDPDHSPTAISSSATAAVSSPTGTLPPGCVVLMTTLSNG